MRELDRVTHKHGKSARSEPGSDRKGKLNSGGETHAAKIELSCRRVLQFNKLEFIAVHITEIGRVIHDFGDEQTCERLLDEEVRLVERAP